jgi:hypothetical protein
MGLGKVKRFHIAICRVGFLGDAGNAVLLDQTSVSPGRLGDSSGGWLTDFLCDAVACGEETTG